MDNLVHHQNENAWSRGGRERLWLEHWKLHPPSSGAAVPLPDGYSQDEAGLWFTPPDPPRQPVWLADPFKVLGVARDGECQGVVIEWLDSRGRQHIELIPPRMMRPAARNNPIAKKLENGGLHCEIWPKAHKLQKQFFSLLWAGSPT